MDVRPPKPSIDGFGSSARCAWDSDVHLRCGHRRGWVFCRARADACAYWAEAAPDRCTWPWDAAHGAFHIGLDASAPSSCCPCWFCPRWRPCMAAAIFSPIGARNRSVPPGSFSTCSWSAWSWSSSPGRRVLVPRFVGGHVDLGFFPGDVRAREGAEVRRAGWVYLVATHLGVAFLFATFVLLGRQAGSLEFDAFRQDAGARRGFWSGLIFVLALDRVRGESRLRSVPRLAAGSPPGRSVARLRVDVGRDDQDGSLRARCASCPFSGDPAPWWGLTLAVARPAHGPGRDLAGPAAARYEASARVLQHREHRVDRAGSGRRSVALGNAACPPWPLLGMTAGAASYLEPRSDEMPDVFRRRQRAAWDRQKDMEKLGGLMKANAVDERRHDRRGGRHRRAAALERLRQRVAVVHEPDEVRAWRRAVLAA